MVRGELLLTKFKDFPTSQIVFNGRHLCEFSVTPDQARKKLETLNAGAAPGPDKLSSKLLKVLSKTLSVPVAMIFNKCIEEGKAPADWRCANITPVFKKG